MSVFNSLDDDDRQKSSGSDVEEVEDIANNSNNSQDDKDKKEHDTSDDVHIVDSEPKPNIHNMDFEDKVCLQVQGCTRNMRKSRVILSLIPLK